MDQKSEEGTSTSAEANVVTSMKLRLLVPVIYYHCVIACDKFGIQYGVP